MIFVVGSITEQNRKAIFDLSVFCWIEPTRNMSLFEINEFRNSLMDLLQNEKTEDASRAIDNHLLVWSNHPDVINHIAPYCHAVFIVIDGVVKQVDFTKKYVAHVPLSEHIARQDLFLKDIGLKLDIRRH